MRSVVVALAALLTGLGGPAPATPPATAAVEGTVRLDGRPAEDAVVYLVGEGTAGELPPAADRYVVDQHNLRFVPRVLAVPIGSTVEFANSDPVLHNVFIPSDDGIAFDLGTYPDTENRSHTFDEAGTWVVLCQVHPEMVAFIVAVPTPHFAVTDQRGRFRIDGVPAGSYVAHVWHANADPQEATARVPEAGSLTLELTLASR